MIQYVEGRWPGGEAFKTSRFRGVPSAASHFSTSSLLGFRQLNPEPRLQGLALRTGHMMKGQATATMLQEACMQC